ncbi:MAG: DUF4386 domain-containing protein [Flammeovirgaceae bacterium]
MEASTSQSTTVATVALLVAEAVTVTVAVAILGKNFNFPYILRQPAANAFGLFKSNQPAILLGYYIFLVSSLLYVPLSFMLKKVFDTTENRLTTLALVGLGICTALFQSIGFVRWIFAMPFLTETYFAKPESQKTIALIYETLNRYAGVSIGEHLGFIAMGGWTVLLGIILQRHSQPIKWAGYTGLAIGTMIALSVGEHFGGSTAPLFGTINFLANASWTFWLLALAGILWMKRAEQNQLNPSPQSTHPSTW